MSKTVAIANFISSSCGWGDYWSMQMDWECYKDGLCRDGMITQRQADSWGNPTTPEKFASWNRRHFN